MHHIQATDTPDNHSTRHHIQATDTPDNHSTTHHIQATDTPDNHSTTSWQQIPVTITAPRTTSRQQIPLTITAPCTTSRQQIPLTITAPHTTSRQQMVSLTDLEDSLLHPPFCQRATWLWHSSCQRTARRASGGPGASADAPDRSWLPWCPQPAHPATLDLSQPASCAPHWKQEPRWPRSLPANESNVVSNACRDCTKPMSSCPNGRAYCMCS